MGDEAGSSSREGSIGGWHDAQGAAVRRELLGLPQVQDRKFRFGEGVLPVGLSAALARPAPTAGLLLLLLLCCCVFRFLVECRAECGCLHRCKEYSPARRLEHDAAQAAKEAAKPAKPNKRKSQAGSKDDEQQKKKTKKEKKEKKEKIMEEKRKRATEKGKEKEDEKEEGKKENVKKVEKKEKKEKNVEETTSPVDFAEKLKDKKKKKTETAELQISSAPLSAKRRERPAGLAPNRCYLLTVTPEDPKADPATKVYYCGECKIFEKGYQTWRAHMARSKKKAKKL